MQIVNSSRDWKKEYSEHLIKPNIVLKSTNTWSTVGGKEWTILQVVVLKYYFVWCIITLILPPIHTVVLSPFLGQGQKHIVSSNAVMHKGTQECARNQKKTNLILKLWGQNLKVNNKINSAYQMIEKQRWAILIWCTLQEYRFWK